MPQLWMYNSSSIKYICMAPCLNLFGLEWEELSVVMTSMSFLISYLTGSISKQRYKKQVK